MAICQKTGITHLLKTLSFSTTILLQATKSNAKVFIGLGQNKIKKKVAEMLHKKWKSKKTGSKESVSRALKRMKRTFIVPPERNTHFTLLISHLAFRKPSPFFLYFLSPAWILILLFTLRDCTSTLFSVHVLPVATCFLLRGMRGGHAKWSPCLLPYK